jgi:hypothetical protein
MKLNSVSDAFLDDHDVDDGIDIDRSDECVRRFDSPEFTLVQC